MNKLAWNRLAKYNKATAAAVAQALVQLVAAFVQFPPDLEQAIGIVLTSVLVYLVPNQTSEADGKQGLPASGEPLVAHMPAPALAAALALSVFLAGCASLVSGDAIADKVLGADCGPESRVFRARALTDGIERAYPDLELVGMRQSLALMNEAANGRQPLDPAAAVFQDAVLATLAPKILAVGRTGEPAWLTLLHLPPLAAELARVRHHVAAFCGMA